MPHSFLKRDKWKLSYLAIKEELTTSSFSWLVHCVVLITSMINTIFAWMHCRDPGSKNVHSSFGERRQIFFLNVWRLQHLNSILFVWTERRIQLYGLKTCMAWAWPCWNSAVCVVCGTNEHSGGLQSHNKIFTGVVIPIYVRSLGQSS